MKKQHLFFCIISVLTSTLLSQNINQGQVLDYAQNEALDSVLISDNHQTIITDENGWFVYSENIDAKFSLKIEHNYLIWYGNNDDEAKISLYNISGRKRANIKDIAFKGRFEFPNLRDGIYILKIQHESSIQSYRLYSSNGVMQPTFENFEETQTDSLHFSKQGYYSTSLSFQSATSTPTFLLKNSYKDELDYFSTLPNYEAFSHLKSDPRKSNFGDVETIKVIYNFRTDEIYYFQSEKYEFHFNFASNILNYRGGHDTFNNTQYSDNSERTYNSFTINYHKSQDKYAMEFFSGDEITCEQMGEVFNRVIETSYFGNKLFLYNNNPKLDICESAPIITPNELFVGITYQALSLQKSFGYLKAINITELNDIYLGKRDIVVLNGIPNDLPVVSGIITTEFQTPLSHINVLSHNRETPNMALADALENPKITDFLDQLICLDVTSDSFNIRTATITEAEAFWAIKEPSIPIILSVDTTDKGLLDFDNLDRSDVNKVGGKAANFSVMSKLDYIPIPENAFAIPFVHYERHLKENGIDVIINTLLEDPSFNSDQEVRKEKLERLRQIIEDAPIDSELLALVNSKIKNFEEFPSFRFRSSTNAEDLEVFSGAGLYSSYSAKEDNDEKTVESAIKRVWSSLWNFRAYEEREYYKIDHHFVSMGVLAHRSFPDEDANGVIVTRNLYNSNDGIIVNVQYGEESVVYPFPGVLSDEIMIIYYSISEETDVTIEYLSRSNILPEEQKTVMTDDELENLAEICAFLKGHYYFNEEHTCDCELEDFAVDIEFKITTVDGERKLYIKQVRPYK